MDDDEVRFALERELASALPLAFESCCQRHPTSEEIEYLDALKWRVVQGVLMVGVLEKLRALPPERRRIDITDLIPCTDPEHVKVSCAWGCDHEQAPST